jgi:PAS domain-containing protein
VKRIYYRFQSAHRSLAELERCIMETLKKRAKLASYTASMAGCWQRDLATNVVTGDTQFASLLGIDETAAEEGIPYAQLMSNIHPDDLVAFQRGIELSVQSGLDLFGSFRVPSEKGERWLQTYGGCCRDREGNPAFHSGVLFDVSDFKQAPFHIAHGVPPLEIIAQHTLVSMELARKSGYDTVARALQQAVVAIGSIFRRIQKFRQG